MIKTWLIIIALSGIIGSGWLYIHGCEKCKGKVVTLQADVVRITETARTNQAAVESCIQANVDNALEAKKQAQRAEAAELTIAALQAKADERVAVIERETEPMRARGLECPALNADFRRWVIR